MDLRVVAKRKQHRSNGSNQSVVIATRQVGPADRAGKQRVADKELFSRRPFSSDLQADTARGMARRVVWPYLVVAERDDLTRGIENVRGWLGLDVQSEHRAMLHRALVQKEILAMQIHRNAERALGRADA